MRDVLWEKNAINNKSRIIAGYCYEWISANDPYGDRLDIELEYVFLAKWNFSGSLFASGPESFEQMGCIHTTQ